MKPRRLFRYLLLLVGLVCLAAYSYSFLERVGSQAYDTWLFDHDSKRPAASAGLASEMPGPAGIRKPRSEPLQHDDIVGRISFPSLQLSAMVREGAEAKTLRRAVGHIPTTALPGQPGNVGVAGHRDTFFRRMGELKPGDRIAFSTPDGDFNYEVDSFKIVDPQDVSVLAPSEEKVLTIVTCYPFYYIGNAPQRYIVRAKQVAGNLAGSPKTDREL